MLFVMFVALYTTRIVLNVLGVKDYGVYNVVCGFVSMFQILNNCLNTGINRFYNFALGNSENGSVKSIYNAAVVIQEMKTHLPVS